jgi:hypothetical protein
MTLKNFQTFQDDTFSVLEELCMKTGLKSEYATIATVLQNYIVDELDYKMDNYLEYELSIFWASPVLSITEYVMKRYEFLITADPDQTLGSLLKNLVIMKNLTQTLSNLPQFQVTTKVYERVCWMFVIPTYNTIVNKDFFNRGSLIAGDANQIWNHYKSKPAGMDLISLQSNKFNAENAQSESSRLIRYLTKKCAEINAEACGIQERLTQIASELSPGEMSPSGHFNSFSSINESSESLDFDEN